MSEPAQAGEVVQLVELPDEVEFKCRYCAKSCKLFTKTKAVVHQSPGCPGWHRMNGNQEALGVFLINSGVPLVKSPSHAAS